MKKRFKRRGKNYKAPLYIVIFSLSFISTIKLMLDDATSTKEYLLSSLISESTNQSSVLLDKINEQISSPKYMLYSGLNKIVEKNNLSVFSSIEDDDYDYENSKSEYVEDPNPETPVEPVVYLYNTHQLEEYSSSMPYDYSVKPNVMIASYVMREKLRDNGISSVVETNNVKEFLEKNNLSYNRSYLATENFARDMQTKYPSIKYLIDIHRDSIEYDLSYTDIEDKRYARVLLVVGLEHTKVENNVGFAEKLNDIIDEYYPTLSRGVLKKVGSTTTSGIYNQNLEGKSVLIEIGGPENKIEEVYNTVEALSDCLAKLIKEEESL